MKLKFTLIVSILIMVSSLPGQSKVGTTAASFLGIPVGAKSIAMGGAFTSIADDPSSLYWNPGIINKRSINFYASQTEWLVGSTHQYIAAQIMVSPQDALGLSITSLNYGEKEKIRTVAQPEGTGEYWEASDFALSLSYARKITDRFSIGGSGKYIQSKIWHVQASQFAIDLGLVFQTQFRGLKIGSTLRNFGGEMLLSGQDLIERIDLDPESEGNNENIVAYLKTDPWPLPLVFTIGASMPVISTESFNIILALDAVRPTDNTETLNIGTEIEIMNIFMLRAGYQSLFRKVNESGYSIGFGLHSPIQGMVIDLDYAYQEFGLFTNIHTWSLQFNL